MNRRIIGYVGIGLLIALTLCFIFGNSLRSAVVSNEDSTDLLEKVDPIVDPMLEGITGSKPNFEEKHAFLRKAAHFLEFALLGAELAMLTVYHKRKLWSELLFMPLFALLFCAMIDEMLQALGDRTSSVTDVCLDFCGGVAGMAVFALMFLMVRRIRVVRHPSTNQKSI